MRRWWTEPMGAAIAAGAFAIAALAITRAWLGLGVPLGPDPALWGLAAEQLARGVWPGVAPGYPALVAATSFGGEAWRAGGWWSLVCAGLLPAAVGLTASRMGAPALAAALAGAATLAHPDLLAFAWHLQPDALATLVLVGVLAAGLRWEASSDPRDALLWLASAALLATVREHGAVVLAAVLFALAARRSPRLGIAAAVGLAALALAIVLSPDLLPDRLARPLRESPLGAGVGPPPDWAKELRGGGRALREAWARGDRLSVWLVVMERALARSGENLVWIGLGAAAWASPFAAAAPSDPTSPRSSAVAGALGRRIPWAALAALSPVLLVAVVWTQRRHTSVLVPIALIGIAIAAGAAPRLRIAVYAALCGFAALGARQIPDTMAGLTQAAAAGHERIALADWMAAQPGGWFLGGQHNEMNLHLRWPRHDPMLPPPGTPLPTLWSGTDWRTTWVAPSGSMPPPFTPVHAVGGLAAWRLEPPEGQPRPCEEVVPVGGTLFSIGPVVGHSAPPCEGEAGFGSAPAPGQKPWTGQPWRPDD